MRKTNWKLGSAITFGLAAAAGLGATAPAQAQQTPEATDTNTVIVTATRREQALQDTPVAITAVNEEGLQRANIVSTADLQRIAPTLMIQNSNSETGGSTVRIRGVGTTGNNPGLEGAVGVFIDGVYRPRSGMAMNNLFDIQRIEVLRGPQGTLFGKNTSAGAITVTPNLPHLGEFDASMKLGVGNFNSRDIEGMLNIPLGETLAARVSGAWQQRDGYVEDVRTHNDSFNRDRQLVRGMLLWEPADNISWRGTVDYAKKDEDCCQAVYRIIGGASLLQNSLVPGFTIPSDPTQYNSINSPNRPFVEQTEDTGFASHLTIDLGNDVTFKNIIAYRDFDAVNNIDADFGSADILYQNIDTNQTLASFEATLEGSWGNLDWLVGGYYAEETADVINKTPYGTQLATYITAATGGLINAATAAALYPAGGGAVQADFTQDGTSWSIFTHNQLQITDRFGAVVGVRYNHEEKEGGMTRYTTNSPSCGGGPFDGQGAAPPAIPNSLRLLCPRPTYTSIIDENETTGTIGLNYKLTDDIMAYVSASHGYKAGGINLDRDAPAAAGVNTASGLVTGTQAQVNAAAAFSPEFSDSWELGIRSQFFDRTLTLNATYFHTDYEDFQLNTFSGIGFSIANAGSVESKGFELEGAWHAGEGLDFTFGAAHVVAKYGDEALLKVNPSDQLAAPNGDPPLAGLTLTNAPKWNLSGGLHYEHPTGMGEIKGFFDLSANYRTHYNTGSDLCLCKVQEAFTTFNGRLGLFQDGANGWEVALWGTNLTNQYSQLIAFDTVFQTGSISEFPAPPRMYGVTFRKNF
ncbi:MAG: TonB-dependent receptor [Alphaproteobacteria bacterium]|nr:MAG: TonB-dependent receptor [Caulobacteraceae bacterium]TPW06780.1 MAG: TonB-dependent receptor [Alphaproteobacteria bacterium]